MGPGPHRHAEVICIELCEEAIDAPRISGKHYNAGGATSWLSAWSAIETLAELYLRRGADGGCEVILD
jgi:hypothetical protein